MPLDAARDAVIAVQAQVMGALATENARLAGQVADLAARVERLERLRTGAPGQRAGVLGLAEFAGGASTDGPWRLRRADRSQIPLVVIFNRRRVRVAPA